MNAYLQTGKAGDILVLLPILHEEWKRTGQPQNLITAREYLPLVQGLEYVTPVPFDGSYHDFRGAYSYALKNFDKVIVPQCHGAGLDFQRKTPSHHLEMWQRVGYLDKWDTLPLVLPRTGKTQLPGPTIFYADHSQSSPFFYKEDLFKLLQETFPTHQIMRASGMRMKNLRDFLPIMDACDLIVSVETSFLHLSKAVETPVIALVCDTPDPWRGSPWSKRFAFHCRYGDFMARKVELVCAAVKAVNKVVAVQPEIFKTGRPHGYNATMLRSEQPDIKAFVYRYHPENNWKTKLTSNDSRGFFHDIEFPKECDGYSMEDARGFDLNGQRHIAYTCSTAIDGQFRSVQAYGPFGRREDSSLAVLKHIVPKYPGNDFTRVEKNWMPIVHGGKLYFLYGNLKASMEQVVLEMDGDKVVKEHRSPAPTWDFGGIRGGAMVPYKGHLLRFFHSRTGDSSRKLGFRYHVAAALMDSTPPFETRLVSSFPVLSGNEKFTPGCHHFKSNVCIVYGAVADGDGFLISGGLNDCESFTCRLSVSDLNL